jgi:hypothetical protein
MAQLSWARVNHDIALLLQHDVLVVIQGFCQSAALTTSMQSLKTCEDS